MLIDLDRFNYLNDTFGHEAGDACLREIGMRLGQAFSNAGSIARLGGDEFALILSAPAAPARILRLLQETVVRLHQHFSGMVLALELALRLELPSSAARIAGGLPNCSQRSTCAEMRPAISAARDIGASLFNDKWVRMPL